MINRIEEQIENVAIYTRVSTEEQANEGFSLESQLERLRAYCKAREWNITKEYVDPGYSGRNTRRPQYQQMMQDIDKWDAILVFKIDRVHRNSMNFNQMMIILGKKRKQFISMQESFEKNNATGRLLRDLIERLAQYESELTGERVFQCMEQKAKDKDSGYIGGRTPFGYRWDPEDKKRIEVPEETKIVRKIFRLYNSGMSMRQIAKKLSPDYKKLEGKELADTTVKYLLHNCFYAGFIRWLNYFRKADINPIISVRTFNKTQRQIRERCHTHRNYKPILLKNEDFFEIEDFRDNPYLNRSKLNHLL